MLSTLSGMGLPRSRVQLVVPLHCDASASVTHTAMPAAATFFAATPRHLTKHDLSSYAEGRLVVHLGDIAGVAGSLVRLGYALAYPANAAALLQVGAAAQIECAIDGAINQIVTSAWVPLVAAARADVILGLVTVGGDGVAGPRTYQVTAQFR